MATPRLSDHDKSQLTWALEAVIDRALNSKKFPIKKKHFMEWGIKQLSKPVKKAYRLLRDDCPALTHHVSGYGCQFMVRTDSLEYRMSVSGSGVKFPMTDLLILPSDKYHADIIEWAVWHDEVYNKIQAANSYANFLVFACTSSGQLKRLLPQEVMRFIPKHLCYFKEVERRSRIPASFTPNEQELDNMIQMLAVGSLSPETRKGIAVTINSIEEIAEKE